MDEKTEDAPDGNGDEDPCKFISLSVSENVS